MEHFLLRVEDTRKRLRVGEETTLRAFGKFVPAAMRAELSFMQRMEAVLVGQGVVNITWSTVVTQCLMARHGGVFDA